MSGPGKREAGEAFLLENICDGAVITTDLRIASSVFAATVVGPPYKGIAGTVAVALLFALRNRVAAADDCLRSTGAQTDVLADLGVALDVI